MPVYDMKCPNCSRIEKDVLLKNRKELHKCLQCHAPMQCLFPTSFSPHIWPAEGIYLEHVCDKGKTFYSKKEMREYAKKNNLEIAMLED